MALKTLLTGTRNKSGGPKSSPVGSFVSDLNKKKGPWLGFKGYPKSKGH